MGALRAQRRQRGAALLIVMILMAALITLGVIGLQAALVAERLAGNYHAANLAQMRAETAAVRALDVYAQLDWAGAPALDGEAPVRWTAFVDHPKAVRLCPSNSCLYLPVQRGGERWVMALGVVLAEPSGEGRVVAQSPPRFVRGNEKGPTPGSDDAAQSEDGSATEATLVWQ